jgi:hypothetical protein
MSTVTGLTVREAALTRIYSACREKGLAFYMTTHFLNRLNVRAFDQDETFLALLKSVRFMVENRKEFALLRIGIQIDAHYFFMRIDEKSNLACITYYFNSTRTTFPEGADKRYKLQS